MEENKKINDAAAEEKAKIIAEEKANIELEEKYKKDFGIIASCSGYDEDGKKMTLYFKPPHRMALGAALAVINTNTVEACEIIFDSAIVTDISPDWEKFRNDNGRFLGLTTFLQSLGAVKKSTYKFF